MDAVTNRRWIDWLALDEVERAPRNPKQHHPDLASSINRFGFADALILDERTGRLVAGHGRLEALRRMHGEWQDPPDGVQRDPSGKWLVPVQRGWASRTDAEAEAFLVAHNRLTEAGGWDEEELAKVIKDLHDVSPELVRGLGVKDHEVRSLINEAILAAGMPEEVAEPVEELPNEVQSKPGEFYALGPHRLICGDSTDPEVLRALMGGEKAHLFSTDPPYCVGYSGVRVLDGGKDWAEDYTEPGSEQAEEFFRAAGRAAIQFLREGAAWYWWHEDRQIPAVVSAWESLGVLWHQLVVWVKPTHVMSPCVWSPTHESCSMGWRRGHRPGLNGKTGKEWSTVWSVDWDGSRRQRRDIDHPMVKPLALYERPILKHTNPGDLCLDTFAGSGTQIIAADRLQRRCYAVELSPKFCDVIRARWGRYAREHGKDPGPDAL